MINTVFGAITAKALLNHFEHIVHERTKYAARKGLKLEREAGRQLRLTVDHLRNAYIQSLDITILKVDETFHKHLQTLSEQVDQFEAIVDKGLEGVEKVSQVAQAIVIALPLANKQPQLLSFSPKGVLLSSSKSLITFIFRGVFAFANRKDFIPSLSFFGNAFFPEYNLDQELIFKIPSVIFNQFDFKDSPIAIGVLAIPWETDGDLMGVGINVRRLEATYKLPFEIFPENPGKVELELTTPCKEKQVRKTVRMFDNVPGCKHVLEVLPSPGWKISCETLTDPLISWAGARLRKRLESVSWIQKKPEKAVCQVKLKTAQFLKATIHFQEFQEEIPSVHKIETIFLSWDFHKTIPLAEETKCVIRFHSSGDGKNYESEQELATPSAYIVRLPQALTIHTISPHHTEKSPFVYSEIVSKL